uniref:Uncharacterized protein n=1 Tax=Timema cristinae TaxID=61476 RepID=A0A7R9CRU9_TIMCR|nr:unnamed protein product [Timema cristinae]
MASLVLTDSSQLTSDTCFRRVMAGKRVLEHFVRRSLPAHTVNECQKECSKEVHFTCEGFNFRFCIPSIANWKVLDGVSISDHNLITFEIEIEGRRQDQIDMEKRIRYNTRKANWDRLRGLLVLPPEVVEGGAVNITTKEFTRSVQRAMRALIPMVKDALNINN